MNPAVCVCVPNGTPREEFLMPSRRSACPDIDKNKFSVRGTMILGEFKSIILKHVQQISGGSTVCDHSGIP